MKRKFVKTKDEIKYESHSESGDGTKELSKKIDKRCNHLTNMIESQNRLLQALARKIDPSLNIESFNKSEWIPKAMPENDEDQQDFDLPV